MKIVDSSNQIAMYRNVYKEQEKALTISNRCYKTNQYQ